MIDKAEGSLDRPSTCIAYLKGDQRQQAIFMDNLTDYLIVTSPFPTASLKGLMLSVLDEELLSINCVEPS
jgi:hypothetical protein